VPLLPSSPQIQDEPEANPSFPKLQQPDLGAPSILDVAAAAERSSNLLGQAYDRFVDHPAPDATAEPGFNPIDHIPQGYLHDYGSNPVETIGGPSAGTVASTFARQLPGRLAPSGLTQDELPFRRSDLHFLRRMAPAQNLWYARRAINTLEDGLGDLFDLPGESNKDRETSREAMPTL
jgi:hypothetical protein